MLAYGQGDQWGWNRVDGTVLRVVRWIAATNKADHVGLQVGYGKDLTVVKMDTSCKG